MDNQLCGRISWHHAAGYPALLPQGVDREAYANDTNTSLCTRVPILTVVIYMVSCGEFH